MASANNPVVALLLCAGWRTAEKQLQAVTQFSRVIQSDEGSSARAQRVDLFLSITNQDVAAVDALRMRRQISCCASL